MDRSAGQFETVAMPLKNRCVLRKIAEQRIHLPMGRDGNWAPTDFFHRSAKNFRAKRRRNQLSTETNAEYRHILINCSANDLLFPAQERKIVFLIDAHRSAENDQCTDRFPIIRWHFAVMQPENAVIG